MYADMLEDQDCLTLNEFGYNICEQWLRLREESHVAEHCAFQIKFW